VSVVYTISSIEKQNRLLNLSVETYYDVLFKNLFKKAMTLCGIEKL